MENRTSPNNPTKQARASDYVVFAIYRISEAFLRLLPMEVVCIIGATLGQIAYYLMGRRRQVVIRNLRIVYGNSLSLHKTRALARKTFRFSGLNLISSIPASTLSSKELIERVEIVGRGNLHNAYAEGHGCILLLAHMGNWEVLTQLTILAPEIKSLASLYRPLNNPLLDHLIKRRRQSRGARLFSRRDGFSKPITHLKSGGTLGVIADQSAGKHGLPVPLFGKLTSMTNLPALLHRKTNAPILPVSMCTVSPGKWKVVFHPPVNVSPEIKKDAYQLTAQTAKAYEQLMRESPADVLWMHNYWRGANRTALKTRGLNARNINRIQLQFTKSFYVIIYPGPSITEDTLADTLSYLRLCRADINITLLSCHQNFPGADHCLTITGQDPPHTTSNFIRKREDSLPAPFDCGLDLSENGSGTALFKHAGLPAIFTLPPPLNTHPEKNSPTKASPDYETRLQSFIERISPHLPSKNQQQ